MWTAGQAPPANLGGYFLNLDQATTSTALAAGLWAQVQLARPSWAAKPIPIVIPHHQFLQPQARPKGQTRATCKVDLTAKWSLRCAFFEGKQSTRWSMPAGDGRHCHGG